jgi:hypothetical protein
MVALCLLMLARLSSMGTKINLLFKRVAQLKALQQVISFYNLTTRVELLRVPLFKLLELMVAVGVL